MLKILKFHFILLIIIMISCSSQSSSVLKKGDQAPQFSALNQDGKTWDSQEYYGDHNLVIYFYPAAMTAGCTKQACSYRDNSNEFKQYDAKIIGISGDKVENLKIFQQENELNFTLLSDPEGKIAHKFGVPTHRGGQIEKEIEGEKIQVERDATLERWTYLINKEGKIAYKDTSVNVIEDSQNILRRLQKIETAESQSGSISE